MFCVIMDVLILFISNNEVPQAGSEWAGAIEYYIGHFPSIIDPDNSYMNENLPAHSLLTCITIKIY